MTPRRILVAGWLLVVLYAYPGYMSYDSVQQLLQARDGSYTGGHPPVMGVMWGALDALLSGPAPMLIVQVTAFLAGAYLLLRRRIASPRAAALAAVAITCLPSVAAVLGVIWKDSQMMALLVLGTALLLEQRRGYKLAGLGVLWLASAMRYNALAPTLSLIVLLLRWRPELRGWKRYAISFAAWLAITVTANVANRMLARDAEQVQLWHDAVALLDITGTLRYAPPIDDASLRAWLPGTPLRDVANVQDVARRTHPQGHLTDFKVSTFGTGTYVPALWVTTFHLFDPPSSDEQRGAISRAWRQIVLGHPAAYLTYRVHVTRERIALGVRDIPLAAYVRFLDPSNPEASLRTEHAAAPSKLQRHLQRAMRWLGTSWLFRPYIYLVIALVVLAFGWRDRLIIALVLSGLAGELALFFIAPTIDYRYSVWLVATSLLGLAMVVGLRARRAVTSEAAADATASPGS
jgi:hypothetical protein